MQLQPPSCTSGTSAVSTFFGTKIRLEQRRLSLEHVRTCSSEKEYKIANVPILRDCDISHLHILPVGVCSLFWYLLITNGAEVVVGAVIHKGSVRTPQSVLESLQRHARIDSSRPSAAHWLVEVVGLAAHPKMVTEPLEPPDEKNCSYWRGIWQPCTGIVSRVPHPPIKHCIIIMSRGTRKAWGYLAALSHCFPIAYWHCYPFFTLHGDIMRVHCLASLISRM